MKHNSSRRAFLRLSLAMSVFGLAPACTILHGRNTTSLVLNVAKLRAYAQAGLNATSAILALPVVALAMGAPTIALIKAASATLDNMLAAFEAQVGESMTVVYSTSELKTRVDDLLKALEDLSVALEKASAEISDQLDPQSRASITTSLSALATIVNIFQALLSGTVVVGARPNTPKRALQKSLSEREALQILGVDP